MSEEQTLTEKAADLATLGELISSKSAELAVEAAQVSGGHGGSDFLVMGLTVFALACFVGYYVVWRVTPALHSPLMGVTNAISSVIIVGAVIALGVSDSSLFAKMMGFMAVVLASINIFGGFIVTNRMLSMFKKKG